MADAGVTQRVLADQVGAHHNRVGEWSRGTRWPSIRHLGSLAHVLKVDLDWLLLGKPPDPDPAREAASAQRAIELAREIAELAPPLVLIAERAAHITASSDGQDVRSRRARKTR
jgi:transcriptional regulator with XRE-family HTH domain